MAFATMADREHRNSSGRLEPNHRVRAVQDAFRVAAKHLILGGSDGSLKPLHEEFHLYTSHRGPGFSRDHAAL